MLFIYILLYLIHQWDRLVMNENVSHPFCIEYTLISF